MVQRPLAGANAYRCGWPSMSELTVETYTQVLRASGLVKDDQLNKYVKELQQIAPHRALDSKQLSEYLLKNNAITTWHHSKLVKGCSKGFFIGSGVVEAGCKTVVGQRLKNSGMFWSVAGAQNVLTLRTALLGNHFDADWQQRQPRAA